MENWGCEFLELENYEPPLENRKTLPYELVAQLVDQNLKAQILVKELDYINDLKNQIKNQGLQKPLKIIVSPNGVTLGDGNHRFICLEELEYKDIPVYIKVQEQPIKQGGMKTYVFARELIKRKYNI